MIKISPIFLIVFLLTACNQVSQAGQTTIVTITPPPTSTATPVPVPVDIAVKHEHLLKDPWTATQSAKDAYDADVISNWHLTLNEAGVENADGLQGYDLLEAVIAYQQNLLQKGGLENPEEYLVELPFSLHELIRTDRKNLVPVHREASRENATYGIGGTMHPDRNVLESFVNSLTGFTFFGKDIIGNTTQLQMAGDLVLLYKTPGFDPGIAIGAVIKMYDGDKTAYAEVFIPTSTAPMSPGDLCIYSHYGEGEKPIDCPEGTLRSQGALTGNGPEWVPIELTDLINTMTQFSGANVEISPSGHFEPSPMWSDGIQIIDHISIIN